MNYLSYEASLLLNSLYLSIHKIGVDELVIVAFTNGPRLRTHKMLASAR